MSSTSKTYVLCMIPVSELFEKAGENHYDYEVAIHDVDTPIETLMEVHQTDQHRPFSISPVRSSCPEKPGTTSPRKTSQLGMPFPKRERVASSVMLQKKPDEAQGKQSTHHSPSTVIFYLTRIRALLYASQTHMTEKKDQMSMEQNTNKAAPKLKTPKRRKIIRPHPMIRV
jgi:hypothetical protein